MKELIDYIIANCSCWSEDDRGTLEGFRESKLQDLKKGIETQVANASIIDRAKKKLGVDELDVDKLAIEQAKETTTTTNSSPQDTPKAKTDEEWLAEAPAATQEHIANSQADQEQSKADLIAKITANAEGDKTALIRVYSEMPLAQLKTIAASIPDAAPDVPGDTFAANGEQPHGRFRAGGFFGGQAGPVGNTERKRTPLGEVTMTFENN